ncbi:MAG: hypothetical protein HYT72_04810 [Candidatus Aenigmarchaeota archaeon]|nr:hypothetical protein [Candidatus Aenigmarchaeota archaeon]
MTWWDDKFYRYEEEIHFCNKTFVNFRESLPFKEVEKYLKGKDLIQLLQSDKEVDIKRWLQIRESVQISVLANLDKNKNKIEHLIICDNYKHARFIFANLITNNLILYNYLKTLRDAKTILKTLLEILLLRRSLYSRPYFYFQPTTLDEIKREDYSLPAVYLCIKWHAADTKTELDSETTKLIEQYEKKLEMLTAHKYTSEGKEITQGGTNNEK